MQTPSPLDRFQRGSLVPTPAQKDLAASTSSLIRPLPSSSSAPTSLYRQSLASSSALAKRNVSQTPGPSKEVVDQQTSPYRVISASADRAASSYTTPAASLPAAGPSKAAVGEVTRLSPSSANAIGRARAAKRLRVSISYLFIYAVVATSPPWRAAKGWLDQTYPLPFKVDQYAELIFVLCHAYYFVRSIWQLAIPGAAALPLEPATPGLVKAKDAVKAIVPGSASASPAPPAKPSPFVKSSPKTRPSLPPLESPRSFSRSPSHSESPQAKSNTAPPPPAAKDTPSRSPSRSFLAEKAQTPDQLRTSLLGSSVNAGGASALSAFQARHSPQAGSTYRRTSGNLERLKAEAALAAAG